MNGFCSKESMPQDVEEGCSAVIPRAPARRDDEELPSSTRKLNVEGRRPKAFPSALDCRLSTVSGELLHFAQSAIPNTLSNSAFRMGETGQRAKAAGRRLGQKKC